MFELNGDYFNGEWVNPKLYSLSSGLFSPDEEIIKFCPGNLKHQLWHSYVKYDHVSKVIESSVQGQKIWRKISIDDRCNYLLRYKEEVKKRENDIAKAIAYETGKPLWETLTEAQSVVAKVDVTINESRARITSLNYEKMMPGTDGAVYFKPIGPCFIIGPFNFPCHLANGQILAALLAGNSIIFKPSEKTIASAQILIECFHAAHFPKGVINFINGSGEIAKRILLEKEIKGVYFTGSKEVGKMILKSTIDDFSKLVALEMGGKNTSIVHHDASIEHTLAELLRACFLTTGQRCTSTSIVAIHQNIKDQFIERFHQLAKKLHIDHPVESEQEPFMGPLIDQKSVETYLLYMGMAKREGFEEIMRGKTITKKFDGYYVTPSIHYIQQPDKRSHFFTSELFGPNVIFTPYEEIDEAIEIANMGEYGLAGAVFTENKAIFNSCLENIEVGLLNLNRSTVGASAKLPFGGCKNSGNHRPAAVSMIDHAVYPLASLEVKSESSVKFNEIKGLYL